MEFIVDTDKLNPNVLKEIIGSYFPIRTVQAGSKDYLLVDIIDVFQLFKLKGVIGCEEVRVRGEPMFWEQDGVLMKQNLPKLVFILKEN